MQIAFLLGAREVDEVTDEDAVFGGNEVGGRIDGRLEVLVGTPLEQRYLQFRAELTALVDGWRARLWPPLLGPQAT